MRYKSHTIAILLLLVGSLLAPITVSAEDTRYANYTTNDDSAVGLYADNWSAQTFLTTTSFAVSHVRVKVSRTGLPGVLTASITATNTTGYPTGYDYASGTLNVDSITTSSGGDWYTINLDDYTLADNTTYALVLRSTGDNATNKVNWRADGSSAVYTGGSEFVSTTASTSWTADTDDDYMFEIWGETALSITSAAVFTGYYETGDWLITLSYKNTYAPYYPSQDPKSRFAVQFMDGATVIAQVNLPQWGYKPMGIYLSAASVTALEWAHGYTVRMIGIDSPYPYADYMLQSSDWKGSDLEVLDSWCIALANDMSVYYDTDFTVNTAEKGTVLNEEGGVIFTTGITGLMTERPDLFQVAVSGIPYEDPEWTGVYSEGFEPWYVQLGPDIAALTNSTADLIGTDGDDLLLMLLILAYVITAVLMVANGMNFGAFAVLSPFLIFGYMIRILPWAALGVAVAILVMLAMRQLWWKST